MQCTVCDAQKAPYKCPKCRVKYCSVSCCSIHSKSCVATKPPIPTIEKKAECTLSTIQDDDDTLLSKNQKKKLQASVELRSKLKSKRLWKDICLVDTGEDRQQALKRKRQSPEFEEFVQLLLHTVSTCGISKRS
jgi:zinc finger HIT domain-containing protein 3